MSTRVQAGAAGAIWAAHARAHTHTLARTHTRSKPPPRTLARARRVAALRHEVLDDAVEGGAVVVTLQAQLHKVAHSL